MGEHDARKWLSEDCLGVAWIEIREGLKILERKAAAWDSLYREMINSMGGGSIYDASWARWMVDRMNKLTNPQEKTPLKELEDFVKSMTPCDNTKSMLSKIEELKESK
jgi:hypothetical protein